MKITENGTMTTTVDGTDFRIKRTYDKWFVSRLGMEIGYCDTLGEVPGMIRQRKDEARERVAKLESEAKERAEEILDRF